MRKLTVLLVLAILVTGGAASGQIPADTTKVVYGPDNQLDLNHATLAQIMTLPIPSQVAEAIFYHRQYVAYFDSIFDLLQVEGMTPEILTRIRSMIFLVPVFELRREELREEELRARELYYSVQRFLSQEGANEGLVDAYVDRIRIPVNVNRLDFFGLTSYQNVSPVDAVAVLRERETAGKIENARQMRSAAGITYWGWRNLRNFVRYDDPASSRRLVGDYQFRIYNTPYLLDDEDNLKESLLQTPSNVSPGPFETGHREEVLPYLDPDINTYAGRLNLYTTSFPFMTNKLRLRFARHWKAAILTNRNQGERKWNETNKWFLEVEDLPATDTFLGRLKLHSAAVGNMHVAIGQGLLIDATDFYQPRRTGFAYTVRDIGLSGDLSRTDNYTLRGVGIDASLGRLRGLIWYSNDDKDAILNPTHLGGGFNRYFTTIPRISNETQEAIREDIKDGVFPYAVPGDTIGYLNQRDVMNEEMFGANLKYRILPGTYVGVTGININYKNNVYTGALADRWLPTPLTLIQSNDLGRLEPRDREITGGYNSTALGNYRRLWGAEAQTVWKNISLAAEYGKLEVSNDSDPIRRIFNAGPDAFIANGYVQYENFQFLAIYRDYDVGYDNPYNRAFSEDQRYEGTLLDGNPFRLNNPYFAQLALGEPQPKSERGWYFGTRYQISRQFTITGLEYDTWRRKADGADKWRVTFRGEYRPIFPVRFRIRHRVSARDENRPEDVRRFVSWDTRLQLQVRLSNYDEVRFLYSTSNVKFSARGRLNGPRSGICPDLRPTENCDESDSLATAGIPSHALQGLLIHNFGDFLSMILSAQVYDGFLYNFEDNEFIVVDGMGFRNWIMVRSRLSEHLSWRFKWTWDTRQPRTYVDIRDRGSIVGADPTPDIENARLSRTSYRFQLDLAF